LNKPSTLIGVVVAIALSGFFLQQIYSESAKRPASYAPKISEAPRIASATAPYGATLVLSAPPDVSELSKAQVTKEAYSPPRSVEARRKEAILHRAEQFNEAFQNEVEDAQWSTEYEAKVISFFQGSTGNRLESIECHSTLCRAVVRHQDTAARQEFSESLGAEPFTGGSFYYQAQDGSLGSVVYLGRPGLQFRVPSSVAQRE
jgi:hypothetical protein